MLGTLEREPDPLRVWSVLDEAALRRPIGAPPLQRAQLHHLAQLARRPTIDLHVLPAGAHPGLDGTFTVVDFPPNYPAIPERSTSKPSSVVSTMNNQPRSPPTGSL